MEAYSESDRGAFGDGCERDSEARARLRCSKELVFVAKILPRKAGRSDGFSPICMVTWVIGARAARTVEWRRTAARGSKASAPNARMGSSMESRVSRARILDRNPAAAAVQHNAHNLRTPKHEGLYRYGRRCGRLLLLFNTTRAHDLRTPKHEGLYRYGRRCGRHSLLLHKPLIGGMGGRRSLPL